MLAEKKKGIKNMSKANLKSYHWENFFVIPVNINDHMLKTQLLDSIFYINISTYYAIRKKINTQIIECFWTKRRHAA